MTNHWIDLRNSDRIIIIGSNAAENHPMSFKFVQEAIDRGGKLISIDPRFTRTSARAHFYGPIRSGTDIPFIMGMVKYVIDDIEARPGNYNLTYIREYSNAAHLVHPDMKMPADLDGVFSGYNPDKRSYDKATWQYQKDEAGNLKTDPTLQDPLCVFQLLKRHVARYTPEKVASVTGMPVATFKEISRVYAESGAPDKAGTILYAMGTTQHTYGTQNVRSYSILQTLLGNMGVAGGGINALRGESNVQGSTDMALLFHILPGYLATPETKDTTVDEYAKRYYEGKNTNPKSADWWSNGRKYLVSLLKAWYGANAKPENDFAYNYLPKREVGVNYSHVAMFEAMYEGAIKGLMCFGQNPAVGGPNCGKERKALEKLDWLVGVDLWDTETMNFWKRPVTNDDPDRVDPATIKTEVFSLPAAASMEKEGSISNSGRWMQWRYAAVHPPGEAKADLTILDRIFKAVRQRYKTQGGPIAGAILEANWNYGPGAEPDPHLVAREVNGYDLNTNTLLPGFSKLQADGSTSSGCWIYCGSYTADGNMAARRNGIDSSNIGLYPEWSWCWPVNRRIIYNRASVDPQGVPWNKTRPVITFKGAVTDGKYTSTAWSGDVPDGPWPPLQNPDGSVREDGRLPFIMHSEGVARLFGMGLADGPFPEHYEPVESPLAKNPMGHGAKMNPAIKLWAMDKLSENAIGDPSKYPIVATTYRVTEHWQAGMMTRNLPWLNELMPEMFVEIGLELAAEKGIKPGQRVWVESARGRLGAWAIVTRRFQPLQIEGRTVHQIGMPWHWGFQGDSCGCSANILTLHVGDANTMIPEFKTFLCDVRPSDYSYDRLKGEEPGRKGLQSGKEVS